MVLLSGKTSEMPWTERVKRLNLASTIHLRGVAQIYMLL